MLQKPSVAEGNVSDKPAYVRERPPLSEEQRRSIRATREGKLETLQTVDDMVGNLLRTLGEMGRLENTYVFYLTDNGFLLGEHRLKGKWLPYEESISTPLIVRGPGVEAGSTQALASNVDLAPTIAELASAEPPHDPDGRALTPLLEGRDPTWRDAALLETRGGPAPDWTGVRTERYSYVEYKTGEKELYDLEADPYQLENLAGQRPEEQAALSARLAVLRGCAGDECRTAEVGKP